MKSSKRKFRIIFGVVVVFYLFAMVFPFFWVFITSFKTSEEIFGTGAFRVIPKNPTIQNYITILFEKGILNSIKNSLIVATTTTIYIIVVATLSAYAISRFHFKGKKYSSRFNIGCFHVSPNNYNRSNL